jgi:hypothetical protein
MDEYWAALLVLYARKYLNIQCFPNGRFSVAVVFTGA